jgi:hypothetical protein
LGTVTSAAAIGFAVPFSIPAPPLVVRGKTRDIGGGTAISEGQPLSASQIDLFRLGADGKGTGKDGDDCFPILRRIDPEDGRSIGTDGCVRGIDREGPPPGPRKIDVAASLIEIEVVSLLFRRAYLQGGAVAQSGGCSVVQADLGPSVVGNPKLIAFEQRGVRSGGHPVLGVGRRHLNITLNKVEKNISGVGCVGNDWGNEKDHQSQKPFPSGHIRLLLESAVSNKRANPASSHVP